MQDDEVDYKEDHQKLKFPDKLYGREAELDLLLTIYKDMCKKGDPSKEDDHSRSRKSNYSEEKALTLRAKIAPAVFVGGYSGAGKSTLISELAQKIESECEIKSNQIKPCYLISGKFDELKSGDPFSALVQAIDDFCDQVLQKSSDDVEHMKCTILSAVGDEVNLLTDLIPSLVRLTGFKVESKKCEGAIEHEWYRLMCVFKRFLGAICTQDRPVILFLDDLQWSDIPTLDLLENLSIDVDVSHLMFIGAYRSNEVGDDHPLVAKLTAITEHRKVDKISVANLSREAIGSFIADTVDLTVEETAPLTKVVFSKTQGNIFFTMQLMEDLVRKQLLEFSFVTFKWVWYLDRIVSETLVSDNVVDIVMGKLGRLDAKLQKALSFAAYMRSIIDFDLLLSFMRREHFDIKAGELLELLEEAVHEGLLLDLGGSGEFFKYVHDRIKQSSYKLIREGPDRDALRVRVGEFLLDRWNSSETDPWMIFVAADHLNFVPTHNLTSLQMVNLNVAAGEKAVQVSAFMPALQYFEKALKSLNAIDWHWELHYDLTLRLYRALGNVELCLGNFDNGKALFDTILEKAKTVHVKLKTYLSIAQALGRCDKHEEALEMHLNALYTMGEFPHSFHLVYVLNYLGKVRKYLRETSDFEILSATPLTDEIKLAAMEHLGHMSIRAYLCNKMPMVMLCILKILRITMKHGLSASASEAFCSFGLIIGGTFGDQEGALRCGRLAEEIAVKLNTKHRYCHVLTTKACFIDSFSIPIPRAIEALQRAHQAGMEVGDMESAYRAWVISNVLAYTAGLPLDHIEKLGEKLHEQMKLYRVDALLGAFIPLHFTVSYLMGRADAPLDWGELDSAPRQMTNIAESSNWTAFYWSRLQLAFYFGELEIAESIIKPLEVMAEINMGYPIWSIRVFFTGLTAACLAAKTGKLKYKRRAKKSTREMHKMMRVRGLNNLHRYLLMRASVFSFQKKQKAKEAFDKAIAAASRAGFTQDAALGNELAGEHCLRSNDDFWSRLYFTRAYELYREWGAHAKAKHLEATRVDQIDFSKLEKGRRRSVHLTQRHLVSGDVNSAHMSVNLDSLGMSSGMLSIPDSLISSVRDTMSQTGSLGSWRVTPRTDNASLVVGYIR